MSKNTENFTQEDVGDENIEWVGELAKESQIPTIIIGIILLPVLGSGLFILINAYITINYTTYAITDRALYKKKGLLSEKTKRVPLSKIQNTEYSRSFVEKQFDIGSVQVSSAGSSGKELNFRAVSNPEDVRDLINSLSKNQKDKSNSEDASSGTNEKDILEEIRKTRKNLERIARHLDDN